MLFRTTRATQFRRYESAWQELDRTKDEALNNQAL